MKYRARNISTGQIVHLDDPEFAFGDRALVAEWILEFDMGEDISTHADWWPSSFHRKDINGVVDPRPYSEILNALRELSK